MLTAALLIQIGLPTQTGAQGTATATYNVTFEGLWNLSSTPGGVVGGAHFTQLIGAVHNANVTFWASGGTATSGVEQVAEIGGTSGFKSEYNAVPAANRKALIDESGTGATGTSTFTIEASTTHHLVTLLSMIGPSPDWFVGVSRLSLRNSQGWQSRVSMDLFPYDAGTEDGTEFSLSNPATNPQGTITSIKGQGKFSNEPMARLTFVLQTPQPPRPTPPPILSVARAQVVEGSGPVVFKVSLSKTSDSVVTVDYSTADGTGAAGARAGADYAATSGTLSISAESKSAQIRVPVNDDAEDEAEEETFSLTLRNAVNATLAGEGGAIVVTGTILDDDDPAVVVSFGSSSYQVSEGGSVVVSVELSADPERELEIPIVVRHVDGATPADYSGVPQSVTFRAGVTSREFEFAAVDDGDEDFGESVALGFGTLPPGVTGGGEATISIADEDTPPMSVIAVTGADCGPDLCRALTGKPVRFVDESTGPMKSRRWDFGDGVASTEGSVVHSWSTPGFYEVRLWVSDGSRESESTRTLLVESSNPAGSCVSDARTRCLQDSRYAVVVDWFTRGADRGRAQVVYAGTNDSGMFAFFERANWEVLIKVLDGCGLNGHVWVYGASATTLGYSIRVTDTVTGNEQEYGNEPGSPASAITDAIAFPDGCRQP